MLPFLTAMDIVIDKLVPSGQGFARLPDGRPVFVAGAYPRDRVSIEELREHKSYAEARRWTLIEPSPDRVEPSCPFFERCGGCDWMGLALERQALAKRELVQESLRRIAGLDVPLQQIGWVASKDPTRYRSRVRLHVDAGGHAGYFSQSSHSVVAVSSCVVCKQEVEDAVVRIVEAASANPAPFRPVGEILLQRVAQDAIGVRLTPKVRSGSIPARTEELVRACVPNATSGQWRVNLIDDVYTYAATGAFAQANSDINQKLVSALRDGALARGVKTFADLYSGAGNFALPLLARGLEGVAVEQARGAVAAARRAASEQGFERGRFERGDAVDAVLGWARSQKGFDLVMVDPPRQGMKRGLDELSRLTRHIAMVSCDPATLARDIRTLVAAGFGLGEVTAFDMFPQTHHVETLVWLSKAEAGTAPRS